MYTHQLRLGLTAFPISPRFSPQVIAHLLEKSNATAILVSDPWLRTLALEAIDFLKATESSHQVSQIIWLPQHTDLYQEKPTLQPLPKKEVHHTDPAIMVHTSCGFRLSHTAESSMIWHRFYLAISQSHYMDSRDEHATSICSRCDRFRPLMNCCRPDLLASGSRELAGQVFGAPAIEPFHGIGLMLLFWMVRHPHCLKHM